MKVLFPNGLKEALNTIKSQGDKVEVQKDEKKMIDF